ncbi:hypothetical protein FEI14_14500 [Lacticaseibacillus zeae]|uniref:Uncharacterized protein n=1 Tax=Lacticaseibacillus zeae TaxID=57037 RepID=A0A5R8LMB4_LACZE|nr:hypothetical protein FEI14_14500 [Lacticaseibacillus zeae]
MEGNSVPKRVCSRRNLRVRTSSLNGQNLGIAGIRIGRQSGSETRSQAQKPTHKDLEPKWPKPSHLGSRPLMFRFLTGPAHAL